MCRAHTPRGRSASLAKRRMRSEGSEVHGLSVRIASSGRGAKCGRTAIHDHSRTPKCGSSAAGLARVNSVSTSASFSWATRAKTAQPRTVSAGWSARSRQAERPRCACSASPMACMRARMPSESACLAASTRSSGASGTTCVRSAEWVMDRISASDRDSSRPEFRSAWRSAAILAAGLIRHFTARRATRLRCFLCWPRPALPTLPKLTHDRPCMPSCLRAAPRNTEPT